MAINRDQKLIELEEAIGNAVTSVEDVKNVGTEGLENASASLNSALTVVNEAGLLPFTSRAADRNTIIKGTNNSCK